VLEATAIVVPVLTRPMTADQFINARLLVEVLDEAVGGQLANVLARASQGAHKERRKRCANVRK
jgi:ATP-dependent 26S proteasome regulatory subunit